MWATTFLKTKPMDQEYHLKAKFDEDYNLIIENISGLKRVFRKLREVELDICIKVRRKIRSNRQNRYFWGVVVPIVREYMYETTGIKYTNNQIYYYLNSEVLGQKPEITIILEKNVICWNGKRFSQMTTVEFNDAVVDIQQHFAPMGCEIPDPNQENFLQDFIND